MADIPEGEFVYDLVVDGYHLGARLIFRGPLRVGELFPLAEGSGTITRIDRNGDDGSYQIHVTPII